jgi:uncharacterized protein with NRDE domain
MCLIVVAHGVSDEYPLVIAANRDEHYDRPTRAAHFWDDAPGVLGGRDLLHGGSWLAITRDERIAAVTNLHGAMKPEGLSRGALVRDFVTSIDEPLDYAASIDANRYAGFHLIAGEIGGTFVHLSDELRIWGRGIHGVSNGAADARWEKIDRAVGYVRDAVRTNDPNALARDLIEFLGTPTSYEHQKTVFVRSDRYGTRSSTAIVATRDEILFVEQTYGTGGVAEGEAAAFRITRTVSPERS